MDSAVVIDFVAEAGSVETSTPAPISAAQPAKPTPRRPPPRTRVERSLPPPSSHLEHAASALDESESETPAPVAASSAKPSASFDGATANPSVKGAERSSKTDGLAKAKGPSINRAGLAQGWVSQVGRLLASRAGRTYPMAARRARLEGVVWLAITVDKRGSVSAVRVERSSGHQVLDRAALASLRGVSHVPAPPSELMWQSRPLRMPIAYRLR